MPDFRFITTTINTVITYLLPSPKPPCSSSQVQTGNKWNRKHKFYRQMFLTCNKFCVWSMCACLQSPPPSWDWTLQRDPANEILTPFWSASSDAHTVYNKQLSWIRQQLTQREVFTSLFKFYFVICPSMYNFSLYKKKTFSLKNLVQSFNKTIKNMTYQGAIPFLQLYTHLWHWEDVNAMKWLRNLSSNQIVHETVK